MHEIRDDSYLSDLDDLPNFLLPTDRQRGL